MWVFASRSPDASAPGGASLGGDVPNTGSGAPAPVPPARGLSPRAVTPVPPLQPGSGSAQLSQGGSVLQRAPRRRVSCAFKGRKSTSVNLIGDTRSFGGNKTPVAEPSLFILVTRSPAGVCSVHHVGGAPASRSLQKERTERRSRRPEVCAGTRAGRRPGLCCDRSHSTAQSCPVSPVPRTVR